MQVKSILSLSLLILSVGSAFKFEKNAFKKITVVKFGHDNADRIEPVLPIQNYKNALKFSIQALKTSAALTLPLVLTKTMQSSAAGLPHPDCAQLRTDIKNIILEDENKGPSFLRLSWHSSGTYDKMSKTGGSERGTIRFKEELSHGANAGLNYPQSWLQPVYDKYHAISDLSYADLYTLAGVVAIETLGGPKIPWRAGRVDSMDPSDVTPDGRLPSANSKGSPEDTANYLRSIFYRMGFNDQELVALSGAHAVGRCHPEASGYDGDWTPTPTRFNNFYYVMLRDVNWVENKNRTPMQYQDPRGYFMMLPSDLVLREDPIFKKYVLMYADDKQKFFKDFTAAYSKLLELGTKNLYSV